MHSLCRYIIAASFLTPCFIVAQETPTEREAARDVLAQIAELEKSLDVPALVARLTAGDPQRDQVVARAKQLMESELLAMSDEITRHPEVGYQEKQSVKLLTDYLRAHDFDVQTGVAGLETAFVARWKGSKGAPNLGVIVEYDALRGTRAPFHGDQHSAQGPIGIAAAVAMAEFLARTHQPGSVTVYGTPAEELMGPPGGCGHAEDSTHGESGAAGDCQVKSVMFRAGVFGVPGEPASGSLGWDGADVIVRSHSREGTSRPAPGFGTCCMNIDGVRYTFTGAPAHQLTAWEGRNALEAVIHLFNNIDSVRSNIRPEARIQGVITEGGAAPNVVPDRTAADFYVRYPDEVYLKQVTEFVDNAAKAAALSTGTRVKIEHYGQSRDGISVATLAEVAFAYMKMYGAKKVNPDAGKPQGFEETGTVSSRIPGIGFTAHSSDYANHTYGMEQDALSDVGHQGFVVDAEAMTALLYDFATRPDYRDAVKREFSAIQKLFDEYLADLRKVYRVPTVSQ
jgi:metal-dependent amidase/aminoacylase/carboxypeptidase family protein